MPTVKLRAIPIHLGDAPALVPPLDWITNETHLLRILAKSWYTNGHFAFAAEPPAEYREDVRGEVDIPPITMLPRGNPVRMYLTSVLNTPPESRRYLYFESFSQSFGVAVDFLYIQLAKHHFGANVQFYGFEGNDEPLALLKLGHRLKDLRERMVGLIMPVKCEVETCGS